MLRSGRFLTIIILVSCACSGSRIPSVVIPQVVNLSAMYNPVSTKLYPAYTVYHDSPSTSQLFVKIFPSNLLFSGGIEAGSLIGQVSIGYYLNDITDPDRTFQADSGTVTYNINRDNADRRFITQIPIKAEAGRDYQLMVIARDRIRDEETLTYLYVDKTTSLSEQNFLVTDLKEGIPIFQPYVVGNTPFSLDCYDKTRKQVYVSYYGREIPLPRPAFSPSGERTYLERPDSLWVLPFGTGVSYQLDGEGIYFFQLDTTVSEGLTLYHFGKNYPQVREIEELVDPLAYLATSAEYDEIKNAQNRKLAVDNFWLDRAGNIEKARELIRIYYNRVFYANYYFTSMKPGWKTDRGMIFIIYGPPQAVTTLAGQEKWIYYKNNFTTTVTFTFNHSAVPYALNNYVLQRSENYDAYWRQAVDTWRRGDVYLIE